jgi:hypothetical protein
MEDGEPQESAPPSVRFIIDEPAGSDFFASHDRLASTLVNVIEAQPELRAIGLLGDWGSGKGAFAEEADGAVRYIVDPLLAGNDGLDWLDENAVAAATWIAAAAADTRSFIGERFSTGLSTTVDEALKERLRALAGRLSVSIPEPTTEQIEEPRDTEAKGGESG